MLKVLIVDDEYEYLECLFNNLSDKFDDNIKIVKICSDGETALNYILNLEIDVILLDLNIPKINGIEILEKMKEEKNNSKVIVTSGESNFIVELISKELTVEKILVKPFQIDKLVEILNQIILEKSLCNHGQVLDKESKILKLLDEFNFNKNNIGYKYIIDSLNFCIEKDFRYINKIQILYEEISKKYKGISPKSVGWNMSKCIRTMNRLTNKSILEKYFPYNNFPSPKIFFNEILDKYYFS